MTGSDLHDPVSRLCGRESLEHSGPTGPSGPVGHRLPHRRGTVGEGSGTTREEVVGATGTTSSATSVYPQTTPVRETPHLSRAPRTLGAVRSAVRGRVTFPRPTTSPSVGPPAEQVPRLLLLLVSDPGHRGYRTPPSYEDPGDRRNRSGVDGSSSRITTGLGGSGRLWSGRDRSEVPICRTGSQPGYPRPAWRRRWSPTVFLAHLSGSHSRSTDDTPPRWKGDFLSCQRPDPKPVLS